MDDIGALQIKRYCFSIILCSILLKKNYRMRDWRLFQVRRRPKYFAKKHAITDKYHLSGNGLYCHSEQSSVFWWKQKGCNCSLEKQTLGKMLVSRFDEIDISSNHFKIIFWDSNKLFFEELSNLVIMTLYFWFLTLDNMSQLTYLICNSDERGSPEEEKKRSRSRACDDGPSFWFKWNYRKEILIFYDFSGIRVALHAKYVRRPTKKQLRSHS